MRVLVLALLVACAESTLLTARTYFTPDDVKAKIQEVFQDQKKTFRNKLKKKGVPSASDECGVLSYKYKPVGAAQVSMMPVFGHADVSHTLCDLPRNSAGTYVVRQDNEMLFAEIKMGNSVEMGTKHLMLADDKRIRVAGEWETKNGKLSMNQASGTYMGSKGGGMAEMKMLESLVKWIVLQKCPTKQVTVDLASFKSYHGVSDAPPLNTRSLKEFCTVARAEDANGVTPEVTIRHGSARINMCESADSWNERTPLGEICNSIKDGTIGGEGRDDQPGPVSDVSAPKKPVSNLSTPKKPTATHSQDMSTASAQKKPTATQSRNAQQPKKSVGPADDIQAATRLWPHAVTECDTIPEATRNPSGHWIVQMTETQAGKWCPPPKFKGTYIAKRSGDGRYIKRSDIPQDERNKPREFTAIYPCQRVVSKFVIDRKREAIRTVRATGAAMKYEAMKLKNGLVYGSDNHHTLVAAIYEGEPLYITHKPMSGLGLSPGCGKDGPSGFQAFGWDTCELIEGEKDSVDGDGLPAEFNRRMGMVHTKVEKAVMTKGLSEYKECNVECAPPNVCCKQLQAGVPGWKKASNLGQCVNEKNVFRTYCVEDPSSLDGGDDDATAGDTIPNTTVKKTPPKAHTYAQQPIQPDPTPQRTHLRRVRAQGIDSSANDECTKCKECNAQTPPMKYNRLMKKCFISGIEDCERQHFCE